MAQPTVIAITTYDIDTSPGWFAIGLTIRQLLRLCRESNWGDLGRAQFDLSDGSELCIELTPATDGGELLASQRAVRYWWADGLRKHRIYKL